MGLRIGTPREAEPGLRTADVDTEHPTLRAILGLKALGRV